MCHGAVSARFPMADMETTRYVSVKILFSHRNKFSLINDNYLLITSSFLFFFYHFFTYGDFNSMACFPNQSIVLPVLILFYE